MLGVFSGPELFTRYPNSDEVHMVVIAYAATEFSGRLRGDAEVTALRFFSPTEIPPDIEASAKLVLKRYLQRPSLSDPT